MKTSARSFILSRQRGVGLVELMVTLLLGALLTAGIISLFTANRQTFRMQDNVSQAVESGSFAIDFITRDLRRAGYPGGEANVDTVPPFDPGMYATGLLPNDNVQTTTEAVNGVNTSVSYTDDQLAIVYEPDRFSSLTTCTGDAVPANTAYIANVYYVQTNATTNQRELMCQGYALTVNGVNITARAPIGTAQALASGVDSFQVLYGIDMTFSHSETDTTNQCPSSSDLPNTYIAGNLLAAAYNYGRTMKPVPPAVPNDCYQALFPNTLVRSVRIGLLMRTSSDLDAATPATQVYPVLDHAVTAGNFAALQDGRIRRLFVSTVALRNTARNMR